MRSRDVIRAAEVLKAVITGDLESVDGQVGLMFKAAFMFSSIPEQK